MNRQDLLDALQFQQQAIFHENIKTQRLFERNPLVFDLHQLLIGESDILKTQLPHQAFFIDAFNQAGAFGAVDFNSRANCLAAQFIRFFE